MLGAIGHKRRGANAESEGCLISLKEPARVPPEGEHERQRGGQAAAIFASDLRIAAASRRRCAEPSASIITRLLK